MFVNITTPRVIAMLKRLLLTLILLSASAQVAATDYTDIWYNPQESGWGLNVVQSDSFMFLTFFIYGADSKPTWFVGQVSQDSSNNFNGTLYSTTGTYYILPWGGDAVTPAGTVSFQPLDSYTAKLVYTVNGVGTVNKTIQRQPLTPSALSGDYTGGLVLAQTQCANSGSGTLTVNASVSQPLNNVGSTTIGMARADGITCTFTGQLTSWGKLYQMSQAAYGCNNGRSTTANVDELAATAHGVQGSWSALVEGGCVETGTFDAVLRP
jgi:hypothetical protein